MRLLRLLLRQSPSLTLASILAGAISGMGSVLFMMQIGRLMGQAAPFPTVLFWTLAAAAFLFLGSNLVSQLLLNALSQQSVYSLRIQLCRRIIGTSLSNMEEVGSHRFMSVLTEDVASISNAMSNIPAMCIQGATFLAGVAYLFWLCPIPVAGWIVVSSVGFVGFVRLQNRAQDAYTSGRRCEDGLFRQIQSLTDGAKELKLSRAKRRAFFSELLEDAARETRDHFRRGQNLYSWARSWGEFLFQIFFFVLLFGYPLVFRLGPEVLSRAIVAFMFLTTPIILLASLLPAFARAEASMANVEGLGLRLEPSPGHAEDSTLALEGAPEVRSAFGTIEFRGVMFRHSRDSEDGVFSVGPLNLQFRAGEVTFLVGGNGSGKTTLAKVLCGLYGPQRGSVAWDGREVRAGDESYRELFSAIFSDFHLFEKVLSVADGEADRRAKEYLALLGLSHKVTIENGRFSTLRLSQGQRKRLALVAAYLENRPFYVFDEWAADQDPAFKEIFYSRLVPDLRAQGKAVLVISHDDRYFHLGDRVVRLEEGHIETDPMPARVAEVCR